MGTDEARGWNGTEVLVLVRETPPSLCCPDVLSAAGRGAMLRAVSSGSLLTGQALERWHPGGQAWGCEVGRNPGGEGMGRAKRSGGGLQWENRKPF